jgi:hypothetical protein
MYHDDETQRLLDETRVHVRGKADLELRKRWRRRIAGAMVHVCGVAGWYMLLCFAWDIYQGDVDLLVLLTGGIGMYNLTLAIKLLRHLP